MIDVTDAFEDLTQSATLKRKSAGSRDANGNWIDGTLTTSTFSAVVQSLTADERLALPEAVRSKETIKLHTITELLTANEALLIDADIITVRGYNWSINQVFDRLDIGQYYKAIGVKI